MTNINDFRPIKPIIAFSGSIEPIILTTKATISNESAIDNMEENEFSAFKPSLDIESADFDNKATATDNATNIPANTPITSTAFHSLSVSINVRIIIAPTNIARDIARSFIPLAVCSNAIELISLEKLLTTFATLLRIFFILPADLFKIFPVPSNTLPMPSIGLVNFSKAFANLLITAKKPMLNPPANTLDQFIFLNTSTVFEATPFRNAQSFNSISLIPSMKPNIQFLPSSWVSVDGDSMPRTSRTFCNIPLAKSTRTSHNVLLLSLRPFLNPSTRSLPTLDIFPKISLNLLTISLTNGICISASIHFLIVLVIDLIVFSMLSKVNVSLNFSIVF